MGLEQGLPKLNFKLNDPGGLPTTRQAVALEEKRAVRRAANHRDHPTWYRRAITDKDLDFIEFLVKHKYAKAAHLALLHGITEKAAYKRLKGLQEYGYVEERKLHDTPAIWFPTVKALGRSKFRALLRTVPSERQSWAKMPHTFVENYLSAAYQGTSGLNPLGLDFTGGWRVVSGFMISEANRNSKSEQFAPLAKFLIRNDRGWSDSADSKLPDLVLVPPKGKPIAVEVELNYKGQQTLKVFHLYATNPTFERVYYVAPDEQDRTNLVRLRAKLDRELQSKIVIVPLLYPTPNGDLEAWEGDTSFLYRK